MRKISTADFIVKAQSVHGDRYDYSRTVYQGNKVKVTIICPEHGEFTQTPGNHTSGYGCLNCGLKNAGQYHKKDTKKFVEEARAIHGERYDYSSTHYLGAREKLTIICPKHGAFLQTAFVHLRGDSGAGCERCSYEARGERARMKFDEFVRRAVELHADAFDYSESKSSFVDANTNVTINCPLHGIFQQTPINHLSGQGCSRCSRTRMADGLRKTNEEFVRNSKAVHGEKYDYSQCNYAGAFEAVTIICAIDGSFTQSPTSHLAGIGCPRCSRRAQGAPRNLTRALRGEFDAAKESFVYVVSFRLPFSDKQIYKIGSGTGTRLKTVSGC